ncbi:hypothetical protein VNO77_19135 [Canavalia gladiata]|uniref:Uncharacterized protein n=1 Tax=Canavalia gladiata TaxID=3824 RepID=A0AAN9QPB9_CANGL
MSSPQAATSVAIDIGDPLVANTNGICCRVLRFRTSLSPIDGSIYTVRLGQAEARTLLRKRWVRVVGSRPSLNDGKMEVWGPEYSRTLALVGHFIYIYILWTSQRNEQKGRLLACLHEFGPSSITAPIHMVNSRSWKLHQYWKLEQLIRRGFVPSNLEALIISNLYYYLVFLRLSSLGLIEVLLGHDRAGFVVYKDHPL